MLKPKDLREQTAEELTALYQDLCREIFDLVNELRISRKLEKPHLLQEKKRDRARVMTILTEKGGKASRNMG